MQDLNFHGGDYEECLLGYKIPVCTSQETHYVSATEPSPLIYVRFQVFTPVTMNNAVFWDIKSQIILHRKHMVSATEPSRLMLCKI
jgi:hypothetical protein